MPDQIDKPEILKWFECDHLPPHLQRVVSMFEAVALALVENQIRSAEQSTALRKLLEAKDAAVRNEILTREACEAAVGAVGFEE